MRCRAVLAQAASVPVAALAGTAGALVSDYFRAPQSHGAQRRTCNAAVTASPWYV